MHKSARLCKFGPGLLWVFGSGVKCASECKLSLLLFFWVWEDSEGFLYFDLIDVRTLYGKVAIFAWEFKLLDG